MSADTYAMEATFLAIANLEEAPCEVGREPCNESASVAIVHVTCGFSVMECGRHAAEELRRLQDLFIDVGCPYCHAHHLLPEDFRFTNI